MEFLLQFFDEVEDFVIATSLRLLRSLSRKPRERRQIPRTSDMTRELTTAATPDPVELCHGG